MFPLESTIGRIDRTPQRSILPDRGAVELVLVHRRSPISRRANGRDVTIGGGSAPVGVMEDVVEQPATGPRGHSETETQPGLRDPNVHSEAETQRNRVHRTWIDHHEKLWRSLLGWSGDPDVASEATSEAFAQALRRGDAIEDVGRWVWQASFRIASGLLRDRNDRRRTQVGHHSLDGSRVEAAPVTMPEDTVVLLDALAQLGPDDRTAVVLTLVGGWPSADVADLLGSAPGAVRVRLHRAKAKLRDLLEDSDG